jgi:hypothetical protein
MAPTAARATASIAIRFGVKVCFSILRSTPSPVPRWDPSPDAGGFSPFPDDVRDEEDNRGLLRCASPSPEEVVSEGESGLVMVRSATP